MAPPSKEARLLRKMEFAKTKESPPESIAPPKEALLFKKQEFRMVVGPPLLDNAPPTSAEFCSKDI